MIYLDHSATSPILPCVKTAMLEALDKYFGNASALHTQGHLAKEQIELARARVAKLINADPKEIIFTSGGSESNNTVINTFRNKTIAFSAIEHPSIIEPAKKYAKTFVEIPVDNSGIVSLQNLPKTDLCSIMLANNELGTIEPVEKIVSLKRSTFYHSDLTQAVGKLPIDVKKLNLDYATFSAHKIGGPTGIGVLYVKQGAPLTPLILGGHQEHKLRAGTYNTAAIIGLGVAAQYAIDQNAPKLYKKQILPLRNQLAALILDNIPHSSLNTPLEHSLPNILNASFQAAEGESIQLYLDLKKNICVSTGSACASGDAKPSHVLMATTNDAEVAHSSIRFSLGLDTTESDILAVIDVLPEIVANLQSISTIKIKEK